MPTHDFIQTARTEESGNVFLLFYHKCSRAWELLWHPKTAYKLKGAFVAYTALPFPTRAKSCKVKIMNRPARVAQWIKRCPMSQEALGSIPGQHTCQG